MIKRILVSLFAGAVAVTSAAAEPKPEELKVGITTYLSGSASVFGVPGRDAADILIEKINEEGGIDGVKISQSYIDEGGGVEKTLSDYRRLVDSGVDVMLASISSGHCNVVAPLAEDLQMLNILWDCGTEKVLEKEEYEYVVRTQANATTEMVALAIYVARTIPEFETIAIVNQDYAWGYDSRDMFLAALKKLRPDVKVVAEMFPKFGASDFSTEISRLQALRPDVIVSTSWGGDLDNFVRQAAQRNLFNNSTFVLALAESSLERLGDTLPEGVLVGARGDHYFLHPETKDEPGHLEFVETFKEKTGSYPIYPSYHMAQAIFGLKAGYEKAIEENNGEWPTTEQVAKAMHDIEFSAFGRDIKIDRVDGQGLEAQLFGITTTSDEHPFKVLKDITIIPAELVTPPAGDDSYEWIEETITSEILDDESIVVYEN